MNYNEFAQKIKAKYPEYADMDNLELTQKIIAKYPEYKEQVVFDKVEKPQQTEYERIANDNTLTKEQKAQAINDYFKKEQRDIQKERWGTHAKNFGGAGLEIGSALIPIGGGAKLATKLLPKAAPLVKNLASNVISGGVAGGVSGFGRGMREGKNPLQTALQDTALGASLGGGLPLVGSAVKPIIQTIPNTGNLVARTIGRIQPETLQRAVQPDSIALDLTKDQAQNLLMDTTERLRNTYKRLLAGAGQNIHNVANNLKNIENRIDVNDLKGDIKGIFDKYQGDVVNPARNMTGDLEQNLYNLVEQGKPIPTTLDPNLIPNFELPKTQINKDIQKTYQKNVQGKIVNHPDVGDINFYRNGARKTINQNDVDYEQLSLLPQIDDIVNNSRYIGTEGLDKVRKDKIQGFDILSGRGIKEGVPIDTQIHIANTPQGKHFYYNSKPEDEISVLLPNGNQVSTSGTNIIADNEAYFNSISPTDLQKIKEQIGHMVNWSDETAKNYQNPILEQLYGKFNDRLSNLSPELAEANKEYAKLARFKKNEGLSRILRPNDSIDSASSVLKNYNSTVTKGNANRNIQDLEKEFLNAGEAPFLKDIDDVNAAMDLLNARATGDSWLANLTTQLSRPALKGVRAYNRFAANSPFMQAIANTMPQLRGLGSMTSQEIVPLINLGRE